MAIGVKYAVVEAVERPLGQMATNEPPAGDDKVVFNYAARVSTSLGAAPIKASSALRFQRQNSTATEDAEAEIWSNPLGGADSAAGKASRQMVGHPCDRQRRDEEGNSSAKTTCEFPSRSTFALVAVPDEEVI